MKKRLRKSNTQKLTEKIPRPDRGKGQGKLGERCRVSGRGRPSALINVYVYAGQSGQFQLYEDEGTNYNYERGKYATIDISYDDASGTVTIGQRKGQFPGMLKQRRFNVVLITKDAPKPLNLDNPEGQMVNYNGKAVSVEL